MPEIIDAGRAVVGEYLMRRADMWTRVRKETSPILGAVIAGTDASWITTVAFIGEVATDTLDGLDARAGAKLLGIETTVKGALADPEADKILVNCTELGLGARFLRSGDYKSFGVLAVNYVVSQRRDNNMAVDRSLAALYGYDPKAILPNKIKTGFQLTGLGILVSPKSEDLRWRHLGLGIITAGTVLGIVGQRMYRHRVRNYAAAKHEESALACPDEITVPII